MPMSHGPRERLNPAKFVRTVGSRFTITPDEVGALMQAISAQAPMAQVEEITQRVDPG